MASTTRIPEAEITGPYGYLLKRFSRKMLGEVPDALGVMWHNRAVRHRVTTVVDQTCRSRQSHRMREVAHVRMTGVRRTVLQRRL